MAETVKESIEIDASPEQVWEVLMDPTTLDRWVSAHRKLEDVPNLPLDEGDTFRQRLGVGPVGFWVTWHVLEAQRPGLARWKGEGPGGSSADVTYRLNPVDDGKRTQFEYENDFTPPGGILGRAAKKAVNAAAGQREARKSMKSLCEIFA